MNLGNINIIKRDGLRSNKWGLGAGDVYFEEQFKNFLKRLKYAKFTSRGLGV
jgi:hypothetical protein